MQPLSSALNHGGGGRLRPSLVLAPLQPFGQPPATTLDDSCKQPRSNASAMNTMPKESHLPILVTSPAALKSTRTGRTSQLSGHRSLTVSRTRYDHRVATSSRVASADRQTARAFWASHGLSSTTPPRWRWPVGWFPARGGRGDLRANPSWGGRHWRLVMTGDDDPTAPTEREQLEQLAADLQVHERAQFVGPLPRLSRWLAASDPLAVLTKPDARVKARGLARRRLRRCWQGAGDCGDGWRRGMSAGGSSGNQRPRGDAVAVADALAVYTSAASRRRAGNAGQDLVRSHPTSAECADLLVRTLRDAVEINSGDSDSGRRMRLWPLAPPALRD